MAEINYTTTTTGNSKSMVTSWVGLTTGDTGTPLPFSQYTDKSVQVVGTISASTTVLEGSNDGANYATLTDPQGNPLSFNAAGLEMVSEATRFVRPRVSGGSAPSVSVYLLCKE
jgi:hypothetical protein